MSAALVLLLAVSPHLVFSYNVDISHPTVHKDPESSGDNYFGYSLSLSYIDTFKSDGVSYSSLFVGAPKAENETGKVYRCIGLSTGDQQESCQELKDIFDNPKTNRRWLGASMATGKPSDFTVCAPRTEIPGAISLKLSDTLFMHGTCYKLLDNEAHTLHRESGTLENFNDPKVNLGMVSGFSVNYATKSNSSSTPYTRIIGQPGVSSAHLWQEASNGVLPWTEWNERDDNIGGSLLGYSVSSGRYFSKIVKVAAGAPSWAHKGMVVVFPTFNFKPDKTIQINGSVVGESFGGSLATADFDNDGYDDLAIGAPHWGEVDFGRVYIYHGNKDGRFHNGQILEGKVDKGMFGYTLASADLDGDGFSDLVVGAPWEESGAVYVYYGRPDFREENPSAQIIQMIRPSEFQPNYPIERFGFSFSHPMDFDGNGYPDLAIGAYKSGHAVVLRSRPVIVPKITLTAHPSELHKNDTHLILSVCVEYNRIGASASLGLSFNMIVDAKHNRVEGGSLNKSVSFLHDNHACVNETISLITSKIRDVSEDEDIPPIKIDITQSSMNLEGASETEIEPVLSRKPSSRKESWNVHFATDCKIKSSCHAQLFLNTTFRGGSEDNMWVIGSGDVTLNIIVTNEDEPAYDTRIIIQMPQGILIRKRIENCVDDRTTDGLKLTCEIANPLRKGKPKSLSIELDMRGTVVDPNSPKPIIFFIWKQSKDNIDEEHYPASLSIKNVGMINLTGVTDKRDLAYDMTEKSQVHIQHEYQVLRSGPSPIIGDAFLAIEVPTSMNGSSTSFLNISNPKLIDGSGNIYKCSINDSKNSGWESRVAREISSRRNEMAVVDVDEDIKQTIYLNCSTRGVICKVVQCHFKLKKPVNDAGILILTMTLDTEAFNTSNKNLPTIEFNTEAELNILGQAFSDFESSQFANVANTLNYSVNIKPEVSSWILPCSIILGILLLCILAFILYKVGFFKRSTKLATAKASKDSELTLHDVPQAGTATCEI